MPDLETLDPLSQPIPKPASRRRPKRGRYKGRGKGLMATKLEVAQMLALGHSKKKAASIAGVSDNTIGRWAKEPDVQDLVGKLRQSTKLVIAEKTTDLVSGALDRAQDAVKGNDPKSFDAWTRGIYATEKTSSSASGEAKRVESTHHHDGLLRVEGDIDIELRALLGVLLGPENASRIPSNGD